MREFRSGQKCKRVTIDAYMDGDEKRTTCRAGEQFCDVCRGRGQKRVRVVEQQEHGGETSGRKRVRRHSRSPIEGAASQERVSEGSSHASEAQDTRDSSPQAGIHEQSRSTNATDATDQPGSSQQQYIEEQRQFATMEAQRRESRIQQGRTMEEVDALFREWKHGCSICRIRGRRSHTAHNWRHCPCEVVEVDIVEEIRSILVKVRWSNARMCCRQCWAPQAICQSYKPIDSTGRMRFQRDGNSKCQYRGVLLEAVSVTLAVHPRSEAMVEWIHEQAQRAGIVVEQTSEDCDDIVRTWFGSKIIQGDVEMSGMCYLFYHFGWDVPAEKQPTEYEI
jgi:hypothetical protein